MKKPKLRLKHVGPLHYRVEERTSPGVWMLVATTTTKWLGRAVVPVGY